MVRQALLDLLAAWESGGFDEEAVQSQAEAICATVIWDALPVGTFDAEKEACSQLEAMHIQLLTRQDIEAVRALLSSGDSASAVMEWSSYFDGVDHRARARALLKHPFYEGGAESILRESGPQ